MHRRGVARLHHLGPASKTLAASCRLGFPSNEERETTRVRVRTRDRRLVPGATYRLQLNRQFNFKKAQALIPYLHALGFTHCYASPVLQAGARSTHGYDVARFDRINPNLGSTSDFDSFAAALKRAGIGLIVDIVPNHMGTGSDNFWWQDVLKNGPESKYATWFGINWKPAARELHGKVLLPVLEDRLDQVLGTGKIRLVYEHDQCWIAYHDQRFPLSPHSESMLKAQLARSGTGKTLHQFESGARIRELLDQQHYLLAWWREAGTTINYRRFFDVSELVSVRMEMPQVFEAAHRLVCDWVRSGAVSGLRVDHPDGLWDPRQYFERLAQSAPRPYVIAEKILTGGERSPVDWTVDGTTGYDFLSIVNGVFVDTENEERFNSLYTEFTDHTTDFEESAYAGKKKVLTTSFVADVTALARRFEALAVTPKFTLEQIRQALTELVACFPVYRTYITENTMVPSPSDALHIGFAVQRARDRNPHLPPQLFRVIGNILLLKVGSRRPRKINRGGREFVMKFQQLTGPAAAKGIEDTAFYNFNRLISLNEVGGDPGKFGASVEEFHRHNRYISEHWPRTLLATATHDTKRGEDARARINILSEFPGEWSQSVRRWARLNSRWKTRINAALAPDPNDEILFYQTLVGAWNMESPPPRTPGGKDRLVSFMLKAVREAKAHTSWTDPNPDYEKAVAHFVTRALDPSQNNSFLDDFAGFQSRIAFFGCFNSLSQLLLKLTSPGVPDAYQGCELWDLNLVDPDNRRSVDYELREKELDHLQRAVQKAGKLRLAQELLRDLPEARIKLFVLWQALKLRSENPDLFQNGKYIPLKATGRAAKHVIAFARKFGNRTAIAIVPRLCATLAGRALRAPIGPDLWKETVLKLPARIGNHSFRNVFTAGMIKRTRSSRGSVLSIAETLNEFPVSLLVGESPITESRRPRTVRSLVPPQYPLGRAR